MGRRGQQRGSGGGGEESRRGAAPVSQLEDLMRRRGVDAAWDALEEMMRAGLPSDRFTVSRMLMRTLADGRRTWDLVKINRSIALVEQFVQQQPAEADEVLFNAMLDTHSRTKDIARLESTYQRMKDLGVEASHVTLGILVKAYGQVCDIKKVLQLWDDMKEQREQANAVTYGCMINACVKCSQTEKALQIFRDMQKRHKQCNTILYTTLIKGYGNEKDLSTAIMLFREMRNEGVPYNTIAYNSIIDVCIKCGEVGKAEEFFQEMMSEHSPVQPDLITYSTLLKGYCQVGDLDKALHVAATIKACGMQCDELVYNTLMDGCVKANDLSAGVGLFAEMANAGMKPSSITHSIFLRLYQRNGYKGNALDAALCSSAIGEDFSYGKSYPAQNAEAEESAGTQIVALAPYWRCCLDWCKAPSHSLYPQIPPLKGPQFFAEDPGSNGGTSQRIEGTMALRLLQAPEQEGSISLWRLRNQVGQMFGHTLCTWTAWEKGSGLFLCRMGRYAVESCTRARKKFVKKKGQHAQRTQRQSETKDATKGEGKRQGEGVTNIPIPTFGRCSSYSPMAILGNCLHDFVYELYGITFSTTSPISSATTTCSSATRRRISQCCQRFVPGHQQSPRGHPCSCGKGRENLHQNHWSRSSKSKRSCEKGDQQIARPQSLTGTTQGFLAKALERGNQLLGRPSRILCCPTDLLQSHDAACENGVTDCKTRCPAAESSGSRPICRSSTSQDRPDRAGPDHYRRHGQPGYDGEASDSPTSMHSARPRSRTTSGANPKSCQCEIRRRQYRDGSASQQTTKIGRARSNRHALSAWWLSSLIMSLGDGALSHIEINNRAPSNNTIGSQIHSNAYVLHCDGCAASVTDPDGELPFTGYVLHSAYDELGDQYKEVFHALHNATELRSQIIEDVYDIETTPNIKITRTCPWNNSILKRYSNDWYPLLRPDRGFCAKPLLFNGGTKESKAGTRSRVSFCNPVQVHLWDPTSLRASAIEVSSHEIADFLNNDEYLLKTLEPLNFDVLSHVCKGAVQVRLTDSHIMIDGGLFYIPPGGGDDPFADFPNFPLTDQHPNFLHRLQQGLRARRVQLQPGDPLRVRSWYIHHQARPQCHAPRIVELEGDPGLWHRDLRSAWPDRILQHEDLHFYVAYPDPDRWDNLDIHADLILVQGSGEVRAGLLTVYPGQGHGHFALATSLPAVLSGIDLLVAGHVQHLLLTSACTISHGWDLIPATDARHHIAIDGQSFQIAFSQRSTQISAVEDEGTDALSLMATIHQIPHPHDQPVTEQPLAVQQDIHMEADYESDGTSSDESAFSPQTDEEELGWHSIAVFDTHAQSARGRVPFAPYEAFFRRTRAIIGLRHHDVARIVQIKPFPEDLRQLATNPLLILRHDDFEEGDFRRAVLVDVEHHGNSFETPVETDRFVIKLPYMLHRTNLLIWINVAQYCAQMRNRCLVWHKGQLVPHQSSRLLNFDHGDYVRVALPPFRHSEVPTRLASQCLHAGLTPSQTLRRFREREDDTDSLYSRITNAQPDPAEDDGSLIQISQAIASARITCRNDKEATTSQFTQQHPYFYPARPLPGDRGHQEPRPSWLSQMHTAFVEGSCTEHEDEGPVGYFDTWFIRGFHRMMTEESRTFRATQEIHWWYEDLLQLWEDKIQVHLPIFVYWVQPTPIAHFTRERLGHLIITQEVHDHLVPAQVTIEFHGEEHYRFCLAAALLPNPVAVHDVRDLANLARHCLVRSCTMRFGTQLWRPHEARRIPPGAGLTFSLHPLIEMVHLGDEHIYTPQLGQQTSEADELDAIEVQPPLGEQTFFTRELYDIWDRLATFGAGHMERLLRIETWFLEGRYVTINDQSRNVVLADDYWTWEATIMHRWRDFITAGEDTDFVLVTPTPASAENPNEIHIIVFQRISEFDHPSLVTIVDDGILHGEPYTTAVILPSAITKMGIVYRVGKAQYCPPLLPTSSCHCWHKDIVVDYAPFGNRHGFSFDLHIQRQPPENFWSDGEDHDPQATSSMSLLQLNTRMQRKQEERLTTGQVAHTQWPSNPPLSKQQIIDLQPVIAAFEDFDKHFFLPELDLPCLHTSHPAFDWTTQWWDFATPGHTIWIYYDGSSKHLQANATSVTAAAAAFIAIGQQWYFAGAVMAPLPFACNSYDAEHYASAISLKFCYDLLKLHEALDIKAPEVHFCFDSLTVGSQTAGIWNCFCHPTLGTVLRNLHRLLESRFGANLWHWHVRGHSGHPGNELVDFLADQTHGTEATSTTRWLAMLSQQIFCQASDWFWILFDKDYAHLWHEHCLHFPMPATSPSADTLNLLPQQQEQHADPRVPADVHLRFATCNVLSLCGKRDDQECGLSGPARQTALLAQLAEEGIVMFGLQETRLRRVHFAHSDDYYLFKAAATDRGHFGIIAGFAKKIPYASSAHIQYKFQEDDFSIIHQSPRILIIRISAKALRCIVVVGHAHHTGQEAQIIEQWWQELFDLVPKTYATWPIVLLADANATVGQHPDEHIGGHQPGPDDPKATSFEDYVRRSNIWLPATFEEYQVGPGCTWTHSSGRTRRIDYVGLPRAWTPTSCRAWISNIIDPSLTRTDHQAACAELTFVGEVYMTGIKPWSKKLVLDHAKDIDMTQLAHSAPVDFSVDVHTHAAMLQTTLTDLLQAQPTPRTKKPKKKTMSSSTWELVLAKRGARRHLAELNSVQRRDQLEFIFTAWHSNQQVLPEHAGAFNKLASLQDMLIAKALAEFRSLGRQVVNALRYDDIQFFQGLLCEGAELLAPADVKRFWAVIRRSLPKFRERKAYAPPQRLEVLEHQMLPHLCELELGDVTDQHRLVEQCHQRQQAAMQELPEEAITTTCLPTLTQFETSLRAATSGKATGLDPVPSYVHHDQAPVIAKFYYGLILKMHLWCTEPIQFKGGTMCMIPKKGNRHEACNYRGILLLASVAKRAHSMMRTALMSTLSPKRIEGQLGGFAHQMVQFGFHSVLTWTRVLEKKGLSTAVLYLDLTSAFHHLIRELVLGVANEEDFTAILQELQEAGRPAEARAQGQRLIGALAALGCDSRVLRLLRDAHTDTWFTLTSKEIVRTKRGTRPGSPLADAVFHTIMTHIMQGVRQWIETQEAFVALLRRHDLPPLTVIWADDVAIPWATEESQHLVPALQDLVQEVNQHFSRAGFTINFGLNKTNAVVSFQGRGAPELRKEYLLLEQPGCECQLSPGHSVWLHMRPTYKHLGFMYASSQSLDAEIRQRIGQARQAMTTLGRAVLWNRHYPVSLRLRLFRALVETKLFYGLGTWRTPTLKQLRQLRTAHIGMLTKVLRIPLHDRYTNARIMQLAATADVRILLAFDRLRYAQKVFSVGPDFLQHLVHCEHASSTDSWLHGLAVDLQWLNTLIPACTPFAGPSDFSDVIEFWQQPNTPWKRVLKKAWRLCIEQESMMADVTALHHQFFETLRTAGAEFSHDFAESSGEQRLEVHACHCGRTFSTPQGLALHKVRVHQQYSPEHRFINGASCPHCLRFFWTSARLQQHLAYMPRNGNINVCYQALIDAGYITEYQATQAPRALRGVLRMDALQAAGPIGLIKDTRIEEIRLLEAELAQIADELIVKHTPVDHLEAGQALAARLTQCTWLWANHHRGGCEASEGAGLGDWWLRLLLTYDDQFDAWTELVFLSWGEHILPDIVNEFCDGDLEAVVEQAFYDIHLILPRTDALARQTRLQRRIEYLTANCGEAPLPHRPRRLGTANERERQFTQQRIPSLFANQEEWLASIRAMNWRVLPPDAATPMFARVSDRPHFLMVHLFSGRRRPMDVHYHLNAWAERRGVAITVLSLDTANSVSYGNLAFRSTTWCEIVKCYDQGLVTATVAGSPCETFSEARHHQEADGPDGVHRPLPRPLRSFARLLGLEGLTFRELTQLHAGSGFFLQVTVLLAYQLIRGGFFISEHPAPPSCPARASIWSSPWLSLLRTHPDINLVVVPQWPFGTQVPKPTGLLVLRLPMFIKSLYKMADPTLVKPKAVAIGRKADGSFHTSQFKEYPANFSAGLARGITDQLDTELRAGLIREVQPQPHSDVLYRWIREAKEACEPIRDTAGWLPDFQPVFLNMDLLQVTKLGLEKPSGTVEKASRAAARRENRTKGGAKPRSTNGGRAPRGANAKSAPMHNAPAGPTPAQPGPAAPGAQAPVMMGGCGHAGAHGAMAAPGPVPGPCGSFGAMMGQPNGQMQPVPVGPWQPVTWGQPRGGVMSGPVQPAAFIDASQRMPQQGYMMPMVGPQGIPSRPATFAGMALDDLYHRQNDRSQESGFASPERGPHRGEPISPSQFREWGGQEDFLSMNSAVGEATRFEVEDEASSHFQAPVVSLQKDKLLSIC
eukprot:s2179_g1.t1